MQCSHCVVSLSINLLNLMCVSLSNTRQQWYLSTPSTAMSVVHWPLSIPCHVRPAEVTSLSIPCQVRPAEATSLCCPYHARSGQLRPPHCAVHTMPCQASWGHLTVLSIPCHVRPAEATSLCCPYHARSGQLRPPHCAVCKNKSVLDVTEVSQEGGTLLGGVQEGRYCTLHMNTAQQVLDFEWWHKTVEIMLGVTHEDIHWAMKDVIMALTVIVCW